MKPKSRQGIWKISSGNVSLETPRCYSDALQLFSDLNPDIDITGVVCEYLVMHRGCRIPLKQAIEVSKACAQQ